VCYYHDQQALEQYINQFILKLYFPSPLHFQITCQMGLYMLISKFKIFHHLYFSRHLF